MLAPARTPTAPRGRLRCADAARAARRLRRPARPVHRRPAARSPDDDAAARRPAADWPDQRTPTASGGSSRPRPGDAVARASAARGASPARRVRMIRWMITGAATAADAHTMPEKMKRIASMHNDGMFQCCKLQAPREDSTAPARYTGRIMTVIHVEQGDDARGSCCEPSSTASAARRP